LHRPNINQTFPKYACIFTDCFSIKEYYKQGLIELPQDGDGRKQQPGSEIYNNPMTLEIAQKKLSEIG
jgi:hypothetical protein